MNEEEKKELAARMAWLGELVDRCLHDGVVPAPSQKTHGFLLITFPFGDVNRVNWVSNTDMDCLPPVIAEVNKVVERNRKRQQAH